ncbi:hypothetical protein [Glycomyces sp. NPDC048151]|uniref:hypothetical protein n=1 Tax=Glycomyces sp. NPDC048151 TaxID=3364002 RepID=UPI00371CA860
MTEKESEPTESDLRRAVNLIGNEAGAGTRKRPSGGLIAGLALAAVFVAFGGFILFTVDFDDDSEQPFVHSLNEAENIACSQFMAVGEVVSVEPADADGRVIVTFEVEQPLKPTDAQGLVELEMTDPAATDPASALKADDRVLLEVPRRDDLSPAVYRGTYLDSRVTEIQQYLDAAATTECPPQFQEGGSTAEVEENPNDAG